MMRVLVPGDVGEMAAQAVATLSDKATGGQPITTYIERDPMAWSVIAQGGWDTIGVDEESDEGASLLDLAVVARAWGSRCVPLPLVTSIMTKRWSPVARSHDGPVSLAVADPTTTAAGRIPFGATEGLRVLGAQRGDLVEPPTGEADDWVPSLRPVTTTWVSELTPDQAAELMVVWAAEATGAAEQLLAMSVGYAKERHQFGKPIGSFQAVKHTLSNMKVLTESSETAVLWAAVEPGDARRAARWALDAAVTVAEKAIQVHGGMGFTWEMGLHYYLRHILTLRELVRGLGA